ncbi:TadE/TadG family type IV pilus assembly protein [Sphingomonas edaphi]|uniref:Pilus assembly protein TadE n=1 Tax=Sphingomonas edaphi TaxID=2315689 RepID=A0A418Q3G5_9SPHN|nr:TadE/TadG family type IV pilus assembly protein [Sphingomonas edaphi]RIX32440.1 pilus assembly protein TadE [Sphingomonas edaphi]
MNRLLRTVLGDCRAASAAEFGLVLPLLLLLLFGIIDMGRFFWTLNTSEKATQIGARMAIVTTPVSPDLVSKSYVNGTVTKAGDLIPASALGIFRCTNTGCTCPTPPCPVANGSVNSTAFNVIVSRMAQISPRIGADNVVIEYSGSGLGYAGPADGTMDVQPLVTVSVQNETFNFISLLGLADITLPPARATLTAEDSAGSFSN